MPRAPELRHVDELLRGPHPAVVAALLPGELAVSPITFAGLEEMVTVVAL